MYKRLAAIALSFITLSATAATADNYKEEFPWAAEAVEYCVDNDILRGDGDGDLMLGERLTQAQCLALIGRTFDVKEKKGSVKVSSGHWAKNDINKLSGYLLRPGDFTPDGNATREMFIATLMNATGVKPESKVSVLKEKFYDYNAAYPEYLTYLAASVVKGYVEGSEGKLFPKDNLFRAEAVTLIYRIKKATGDMNASVDAEENNGVSEEQEAPLPSMSLKGAPQITYTQAIKWARSKGAHQRYLDVAQYYWKYGEMMGIRPEVLYAQAGKETGYGNYGGRVLPEMNNWAGIKKYGATGDETEDHETFATPEDGVRGHFNHMSAYVGVNPVGETHGRYKSVKSLLWAGTITDVNQLGGTWCPDKQYGVQVIKLVEEMINY